MNPTSVATLSRAIRCVSPALRSARDDHWPCARTRQSWGAGFHVPLGGGEVGAQGAMGVDGRKPFLCVHCLPEELDRARAAGSPPGLRQVWDGCHPHAEGYLQSSTASRWMGGHGSETQSGRRGSLSSAWHGRTGIAPVPAGRQNSQGERQMLNRQTRFALAAHRGQGGVRLGRRERAQPAPGR
jgi:hypothetical protein